MFEQKLWKKREGEKPERKNIQAAPKSKRTRESFSAFLILIYFVFTGAWGKTDPLGETGGGG